MRVLIAGGVFRLSDDQRNNQQPTPEMTLVDGLAARGVQVSSAPLEDIQRVALARTFDLVHVHHASKAAVAAAMFPKRRPMVFTPHSTNLRLSAREALGLRGIMLGMSATVCLSHREKSIYAERFPRVRDRIVVIPNGLAPIAPAAKRRLRADGRVRILFVGQLIELKRVNWLIRALVRHSNVELRLVYHNSELEDDLKKLAYRLGVAKRVAFLGRRSGAQLATEYLAAHVFALPSLHESLPSVVTEALQTALPVIASDVGGIAEQVGPAGLLVPPDDESAFSDGLSALLADYEFYAARAEEQADAVRYRYSIDNMVSRHVRLYSSLLGKNRF